MAVLSLVKALAASPETETSETGHNDNGAAHTNGGSSRSRNLGDGDDSR
jgi:hypothetical protein